MARKQTEPKAAKPKAAEPKAAEPKAAEPKAAAPPVAPPVAAPEKPAPSFNKPASKDGQKPHKAGTKRARTLDLLRRPACEVQGEIVAAGATFAEVQAEILERFGEDGAWDRRTATDGIRLLHSALGYALVTDPATGKIRALTTEEVATEAAAATEAAS